jgi:hypothetical protein
MWPDADKEDDSEEDDSEEDDSEEDDSEEDEEEEKPKKGGKSKKVEVDPEDDDPENDLEDDDEPNDDPENDLEDDDEPNDDPEDDLEDDDEDVPTDSEVEYMMIHKGLKYAIKILTEALEMAKVEGKIKEAVKKNDKKKGIVADKKKKEVIKEKFMDKKMNKTEKEKDEFGYTVGTKVSKFVNAIKKRALTMQAVTELPWNDTNSKFDGDFSKLKNRGLAAKDDKGRMYIIGSMADKNSTKKINK